MERPPSDKAVVSRRRRKRRRYLPQSRSQSRRKMPKALRSTPTSLSSERLRSDNTNVRRLHWHTHTSRVPTSLQQPPRASFVRLGRENVEHELADEPGAVRGEHGETDGWGEGELGLDHPQEPDGGRHDQPEHVLDCQCLAACGGRGVAWARTRRGLS